MRARFPLQRVHRRSPLPGGAGRARAAVVTLGAVAGCAGGSACSAGTTVVAPPPPRNVVAATPSLAFTPAELTIAAGDSVVWTFGGLPHTVVFWRGGDSGADDRGTPADIASTTNGSVARTFPARGSFRYRCTIHPGMTGEVRVR